MTRKEREENPGESFDGGYHLYAEEKHKERVAKNPDRISYAIEQFEKYGIEYCLKNTTTGHFHCWRKSDGKLFQFYAGTGKIQSCNARGIRSLIRILTEDSGSEPKRVREEESLFESVLNYMKRHKNSPDLHSARFTFISETVAFIDYTTEDCFTVDVYSVGSTEPVQRTFKTAHEVSEYFGNDHMKAYEM